MPEVTSIFMLGGRVGEGAVRLGEAGNEAATTAMIKTIAKTLAPTAHFCP
jgi:hypothetical protein